MNAQSRPALPVIYAPAALQELDAIWDWTEKTYSRSHAASYIDFLVRHVESLGRRYAQGHAVDVRPDLRYVLIRRKAKGHGHVAVYRFNDTEVHILHVFHTAQDWQAKLADEPPV